MSLSFQPISEVKHWISFFQISKENIITIIMRDKKNKKNIHAGHPKAYCLVSGGGGHKVTGRRKLDRHDSIFMSFKTIGSLLMIPDHHTGVHGACGWETTGQRLVKWAHCVGPQKTYKIENKVKANWWRAKSNKLHQNISTDWRAQTHGEVVAVTNLFHIAAEVHTCHIVPVTLKVSLEGWIRLDGQRDRKKLSSHILKTE